MRKNTVIRAVLKKRELRPGNIIAIGSAHLVSLVSIWYLFAHGYTALNWALFGAFFLANMYGVTIGYHRMLTHRGLRCGPVLRVILSIFGGIAAQGSEYTWVANHRVHHFFSDQEFDPHSPLAYPGLKGLLWAHIGWLFYDYERPKQYQTFRDLDADPVVAWQQKYYLPIVFSGFIIPYLLLGWPGLLLCGFLRLVLTWHISWSVNSVCHYYGTPAKDLNGREYRKDDSRNNVLVAIFSGGEGYHANHHARPAWAYHGWYWYNIDASKWLLQLLEMLGLVTDVKKPDRSVHFEELEYDTARLPIAATS